MAKYFLIPFMATLVLLVLNRDTEEVGHPPVTISYRDSLLHEFARNENYYSSGFDFPVGPPDAKGYYNAQGFTKNNHLGEDWNGNGGGNSDMGDKVFSISEGLVVGAVNHFGGWGKVVRVVHAIRKDNTTQLYESLYAHHSEMKVHKGDWLKRGEPIATIGNAEGVYLAHLHLEIRDSINMPLGGGYSADTRGFVNPTEFIRKH